jgi:hypothetical protein
MKYYNFNILRNIDLNIVLKIILFAEEIVNKKSFNTRHYLLPDKQKIAVTGSKWFDNTNGKGGLGALDLIMHIQNISLYAAADKLEAIYDQKKLDTDFTNIKINNINIPEACHRTWSFVKNYLVNIRLIPENIINQLYNKSLVWSDKNKNCVFPRDLNTGAFLRGTLSEKPFKLTIGQNGMPYIIPGDNLLIITEAPIDAISLKYYYPTSTILATGGRIGFDKIEPYLEKAFKVLLAQDNDIAGDEQAKKLATNIKLNVERLYPPNKLKDWNDVLKFDIKNNKFRARLF